MQSNGHARVLIVLHIFILYTRNCDTALIITIYK